VFKKVLTAKYWTGQRLLLLAFLLLHTTASFCYIAHQNITYDEPDYIEYAKRWLHGHPERIQPLDDSKSPVVAISWVPRIIRQTINPNYYLDDYGRKDQKEGRYMMILFSFFTAIYVYKWCHELYGEKGWSLPLLLLLFDPLYLAYTTLITTDLACGAFLVAVLYHFRKYILTQSGKHFWLAALLTGLGIVTKQSLLFLVLLLPALSFVYHLLTKTLNKFFSRKAFGSALLYGLVLVLVINVLYYFHHSFMLFGNYQFESSLLKHLQQYTFLQNIPMPLPQGYVQSLDMLKAHADLGAGKPESTFNGVYLFGELKLKGSYWYYYLVLLFYKLPIGTMVLFISCVPLFIKKFRLSAFATRYMFLLMPVLFYFIILSFFNQFQSGVRHILLVFPLLFIGLGYLFKQLQHASIRLKILVGAAITYSMVTVAIYYPYIIPYTNEFIADKKTVYRKIYDSSVDYGQSDLSVQEFINQHSEYKPATEIPSIGKYAVVSGDMLNTYLRNTSKYKWYMAFEPKSHYRYTILLFDITKEDLQRADLHKTNFNIISK
jgi:hypothetical protein